MSSTTDLIGCSLLAATIAAGARRAPARSDGAGLQQRQRAARSAGPRTRRRSTRSSARTRRTTRLGDQLGPARQLQPEGPLAGARASRRAGTSPTTRRRSPSSSIPDAKWSDGKPITSADVKSRSRCSAATAPCSPATPTTSPGSTRRTPTRSSSTPSGPTRGSSAACSSTSSRSTSGGRCRSRSSPATYKPELPLVGSGPYIVTEFERGRIIRRWSATRTSAGRSRSSTRSSSSSTATRTRSSAPCSSARSTWSPRCQPTTSPGSATSPTSRRSQAASPSYTQLAFNLLPEGELPGREVQPGDPGPRRCARRSPTRSTASGSTRSPPGTPRSPPTGSCPTFYKSFYEQPAQDYPYDPEKANQILDDAGWAGRRRRVRGRRATRSSSFNLYVRSESPYNIQAAKLVAEEAKADRGRLQRPGRQRRQAHRPHDPEGRRQAGAGLRHVHLGLGRRPVRPELPAQPPHDRARSAARRTPSTRTPSTTGCTSEQAGEFDVAERKEIIQRMVAITQRDLPYLVLTVRPEPAGVPDRHGRRTSSRSAPRLDRRHRSATRSRYEPLLTIAPAAPAASAAKAAASRRARGRSR